MISIDRKKYDNHYKPGLTFHKCVFDEILPKILHAYTILVGATADELKRELIMYKAKIQSICDTFGINEIHSE
ncbi:hypothetical protein T03_12802 [Trichinella britovi]|uniref:Uncharacterized protein n=1 Tax=Trichinella britovi TaxID=45882 RepID=A0A0V1CP58_TRIBR|nr:hypothetical protein T03_12802 [Trichinella britovi]